jgi:hypothetical protein
LPHANPGTTNPFDACCYISCATDPCFVRPDGWTTKKIGSAVTDVVLAGSPNVYHNAQGGALDRIYLPPIKCACATCDGKDDTCKRQFWKAPADAMACAIPAITPQPGESFPSTMYARVCASLDLPLFTGWEEKKQTLCMPGTSPKANYSVWCPGSAGVPV